MAVKTNWRIKAHQERERARLIALAILPGLGLVALGYVTGEVGMYLWPAIGGWIMAMSGFAFVFMTNSAREMDRWADEDEGR